jgi:hypothetical protein
MKKPTSGLAFLFSGIQERMPGFATLITSLPYPIPYF